MSNDSNLSSVAVKLAIGFAAGFITTLAFHQVALTILTNTGFVKAVTYSMQPAPPFGVPQVFSLSFWGGIWGVLFASVEHRFPKGADYWITALLFGAILPTLAAWFVVAPLKGQPLAAGWHLPRMVTGFIINGAWGIGTALLLAATCRMTSYAGTASPSR